MIPEKDKNGNKNEKPDGYFTVTFKADANGSLSGDTVYYVKPNTDIDLTNTANTITKNPNVGYTAEGGTWGKALKGTFKENTEFTFEFKKLADVIPATDGQSRPDGYVIVKFLAGSNGSLEGGNKTYYVNPKANVKIGDAVIPVPKPTPNKDYKFDKWFEAIDKDEPITGNLTFVANFVSKSNTQSTTDQETKPGSNTGGSGTIVVPSTPKPTPEKPSEGDLNKDDHYQYLIGYPDGTFAPNRGMTRAEVATMFTRLLKDRPVKWLHYSSGLSDIYAGDWYADTVGYAVEKGIVSGYPDGSFRPEQAISRAEVTSITNRMLNRYADLDWIDAHRAEVIRFSDVGRSDWFFEPVMEATMGHDFTRDADGKTEHWTGLNGKTFI